MFQIREIFRARTAVCGFAVFLLALSSSARANSFSVLYSFCSQSNCLDGQSPSGVLIADEAGNLYSTTFYGGTSGKNNGGTVFKLAPGGTESVLYSFCSLSSCTDGANPAGGVIADEVGNLYGTTFAGGANNGGTVFKLAPDGTETVLYSFCSQSNCADGANPFAGVIADKAGNLYGTTSEGGVHERAGGTVFKIAPNGRETVLYSFCSLKNCADGEGPNAGLIADKAGNLYGTTGGGGTGGHEYGGHVFGGTVFKLAPHGVETVLYSFCSVNNCADGFAPVAGVIADKAGNLYGTAEAGGNAPVGVDSGTVFKITPGGTETVLYSFCSQLDCADGAEPEASLIADRKGNLYGSTVLGGTRRRGSGTIFRLAPTGIETVIHYFSNGRGSHPNGSHPGAGLFADGTGNLYGTTLAGGANNQGTVFKLTK